jgi:hypothetical protein
MPRIATSCAFGGDGWSVTNLESGERLTGFTVGCHYGIRLALREAGYEPKMDLSGACDRPLTLNEQSYILRYDGIGECPEDVWESLVAAKVASDAELAELRKCPYAVYYEPGSGPCDLHDHSTT